MYQIICCIKIGVRGSPERDISSLRAFGPGGGQVLRVVRVAARASLGYIGLPDPKNRSEGFPRTGYFVPGCDGMGTWQISGVVRVTARALFLHYFGSIFSYFQGKYLKLLYNSEKHRRCCKITEMRSKML